MKLEDQACSVELAKKLNELGVGQDSEFYWRKYSLAEKPALFQLGGFKRIGADLAVLSGSLEYEYSAFSVAELGEMLPKTLPTECHHTYDLEIRFTHLGWEIRYEADCNGSVKKITHDISEANARGKMLIYLLENKLTEMKE